MSLILSKEKFKELKFGKAEMPTGHMLYAKKNGDGGRIIYYEEMNLWQIEFANLMGAYSVDRKMKLETVEELKTVMKVFNF